MTRDRFQSHIDGCFVILTVLMLIVLVFQGHYAVTLGVCVLLGLLAGIVLWSEDHDD